MPSGARAGCCRGERPGARARCFFSLRLAAGDSVIVARGEDGELRALHNTCRHRGMPVCPDAEGHARRWVCPYHQWSYALDGRLLGCGGEELDADRTDCATPEWRRSAAWSSSGWARPASSPGPSTAPGASCARPSALRGSTVRAWLIASTTTSVPTGSSCGRTTASAGTATPVIPSTSRRTSTRLLTPTDHRQRRRAARRPARRRARRPGRARRRA